MSGLTGGGSNVHFDIERVDPELCSSLECQVQSMLTTEVVIAGAILAGLLFLGAFYVIRSAEDRCREERRRTQAEAQAFFDFAEQVSDLAPAPSVELTSTPTALLEPPDGGGLNTVADVYRATVMSVDHYDEEYGEPFLENVEAEFGPETATALEMNDRLTEMLQRTLIAKGKQAVREREVLDAAVAAELDELGRFRTRLVSVERARNHLMTDARSTQLSTRFDYLRDTWDELDELEAKLDELVADRQDSLADPPLSMRRWGHNFYEYLYGPLEGATYPVLAEALDLVKQLHSNRQEVEQRLATAF